MNRLFAAALLLSSPFVFAQPVEPNLTQAQAASFARPYAVGFREVKAPRPMWAGGALFAERPKAFRGLARVDQAGFPAFDEATQAWYASADGSLVRADESGRLTVMTDDVQGRDLDVRAAKGLAVSREPGDRIVLHAWRGGDRQQKVLLTGEYFFNPRLSPDGSRVLVAESRAGGGHMWLVETASGQAIDLGQGYDAAWHPDGQRVVFVRLQHDGEKVTASTVYLLDLSTRRETALLRAQGDTAPLAPAISPDGTLLAYATAGGGVVLIAPLGAAAQGGGR
jgi:hypothetical protein